MRLIDADALIKDLDAIAICVPMFKARKSKRTIVGEAAYRTFYIFMEHINNAPTIEMRPKSKWVEDTELIGGHYHRIIGCLNCGFTTDRLTADNYCPNCGADMRGGD